jgi:hypothetical protein
MYRETDAQNVISSIEVIGNVYENPELLGVWICSVHILEG